MPFDDSITGMQTPERLHALCRLIRRGEYTQLELFQMLQPSHLNNSNEQVRAVWSLAKKGGLIVEHANGRVGLSLEEGRDIGEPIRFRRWILDRLLSNGNFVFNKFTSWYLHRGERVLADTAKSLEEHFFSEVSAAYTTKREYNASPNIPGWLKWAAYLGYGVAYNGMLIPNAAIRLQEQLWFDRELERNKRLPFATFMSWARTHLPELDGGAFFEMYRKSENAQRQQLSLALSMALRTLHGKGIITMHRIHDAKDVWYLFENPMHPISHAVTDITIHGGEGA